MPQALFQKILGGIAPLNECLRPCWVDMPVGGIRASECRHTDPECRSLSNQRLAGKVPTAFLAILPLQNARSGE